MGTNGMIYRFYELWPGNNFFLFFGRIRLGPDLFSWLATLILISIPWLIFLSFGCLNLVGFLVIFYILGLLIYLGTISMLFLLLIVEPGYIERKIIPEDLEAIKQNVPILLNRSYYAPPPKHKQATIKGRPFTLKYCDTCNIYRPPRAIHCSSCDACVMRFDHHCPWIGNCIGARNYRLFVSFLLLVMIGCVYILLASILNVVMAVWNIYQQVKASTTKTIDPIPLMIYAVVKTPGSLIAGLYVFITWWGLISLTVTHLYLISKGLTTNEHVKRAYEGGVNPFSKGLVRNFLYTFTHAPKSRMSFRRQLSEDEALYWSVFHPRRYLSMDESGRVSVAGHDAGTRNGNGDHETDLNRRAGEEKKTESRSNNHSVIPSYANSSDGDALLVMNDSDMD